MGDSIRCTGISPKVSNVVKGPTGWLIWYRKIRVLDTIKIIVIRGKFFVGLSSLRGIIKGKVRVEACYYDKINAQYNYREPFK